MEKKIEIGKNAKVEITWNVQSGNYTKEKERAIASVFAKKYEIPVSNVSVVPNYVTKNGTESFSMNVDSIKNIRDPKFQQELFKQWMNENGIEFTEDDFSELVKIDSQINSLIDYDKYDKSRKYTVKWIKWHNILSYGNENFFDFTKLKGLVLLNGEPANKSGKSTFAYDLLHILLFGKTRPEKAETMAQLFNRFLPDEPEAGIEGCINIEGCDYIIKRTFTRSVKSKKAVKTASQKLEYFKVLDNGEYEELSDSENLQGKSNTETNKIIKEAIGNEEDFNLIISANGKDLDDLISLKETARGKLLTRWVGLSIIEDKDVKARELWNKSISVGRFCDLYNREELKNKITEDEKSILELSNEIEKRNDNIKKIDEEAEKANKSKELLLSSKSQIDNELFKYDRETVVAKLATVTENGKKKRNEEESITEELKEFGDKEIIVDEEKYKALQNESNGIISRTAEIKATINSLKKTNIDLASKEYCPTCGRKFENIDNSGKIKENEIEIEKLIADGVNLKERKDKISSEMEEIEKNRELAKNKSKLELKLSAVNIDIEKLISEYKENTRILSELDKMKDAIIQNNKIDTEVNCINASLREFEKAKKLDSDEIKNCEKLIDNLKNSISTSKSYIVKINEEEKIEKYWKLYLKAIGKDGICKMVLKNALPIINGELHALLSDVSDFDVEVTINEKNDVEFWLVRDGVYLRLSGCSGLETTQAALALRVVLGNMSTLSKPPFILLDEILGTVAKENYDDMKKLYDKIVKYYDFVLHITHLNEIIDWHTGGIVTVRKENNISEIKSTLQ